jgi:hypothetical protein
MYRAAMIGILLGSFVLLAQPETAQGRKEYFDGFKDEYPNLAPQIAAQKCLVCHGKDNKKQRSEYAKLLEQELGARNVKNKNQITAALQKIETLEVAPGQTYRDLFDAGMLPPPYVPPKEEESRR